MNKAYTSFPLMVILLTCISTLSFAQTGILKGLISDTKTGEALIAATISAGENGTVTDYDGRYELTLRTGSHSFEVSYIGYEIKTIKVTITDGTTQTLDIGLDESTTLLQTATVSSGRYEKPLGEATVSIDVIKPGLIESNNSTSVDDVLNKIPGVNIIDGQANIRGGSGFSYGAGSRVLLLMDDIPALQADAGRPNWDDIPVENVEQIEVIKGAASALYGSAALNGIVNVRTAYAKSEPVTKASVFATTYDAPKDKIKHWWKDTSAKPFAVGASFAHRQKFGKLDFVSSAYYLYNDSWNKETWERYGRATLGLRYRATDRLTYGLNSTFNTGNNKSFFYWQDAEANAMIGNPDSFSKTVLFRYTLDPFITYFDNKGNRHKFLGRIYSINNSVTNSRSNKSTLAYGEYQFQRKFEGTGFVMTAGILGSKTNIDADFYGDDKFRGNNAAAYLQVEKKLFNKLNISGGVRYEHNATTPPDSILALIADSENLKEGKPIFRLGLNYQVTDYTYLRASWGQGYRFPTLAEQFITTDVGFLIAPNYNVRSETGWNREIGIKQGFRVSNWEGFFDVAAFWSEYQNMMEFVFGYNENVNSLAFSAQNVGNTVIKGIDLSVMGQGEIANAPTTLIAGYTYVDPQFAEFTREDSLRSSVDYNILKYRYKTTWKFDVESRLGPVSLALAGFYNSHMEAIDAIFENFISGLGDYRIENKSGSTVFDVRLAYHFGKKAKLSFLAKNVFNTEYTLRPALLEAPRNFTMKFEKTF